MPIEVWTWPTPNGHKVHIALEELGLPYTVAPVDVFTGKQFDADFIKLNPNAKVPVIGDTDGPGGNPLTLFESGAILLYLAEKTGKLLPADIAAKYEAIQWMMVQMTGVGPMFGQHVHFMRFAPAGNDYSKSRYATQVHRVFFSDAYTPLFEVTNGDRKYLVPYKYRLIELNGRTDYCFTHADLDCRDSAAVEKFVINPTDNVALLFSGPELYHFRAIFVSGSRCELSAEFKVCDEGIRFCEQRKGR